ncbi:Transposase (08) [Streptococcus pluranimalium]|uniref:transposase n=1 Tax=Streptococcus pluranimalium TaxID=82348 RepID=UPI0039ED8B5B
MSYRTINRLRVAKVMEALIRELFIELTLRLKMEDFISLDCLSIDGTKIEANANKYRFVWKKAVDKFSAKLQKSIRHTFQEDISPLIKEAISLDNEEGITSEQLADFVTLLENE